MNVFTCQHIKLHGKHIEIISNFYIYNAELYIGGKYCSNKLTSLYGCPKIVRGYFNCSYNNLTSLKHCPIEVYGDFDCTHNYLKTLKYCPEYVKGDFYCHGNTIYFNENYVRSLCKVKGKIITIC